MLSRRFHTYSLITIATSHLTTQHGRTVLNVEDFYEIVTQASARYFDALTSDAQLRSAFIKRVDEIGLVMVLPPGEPCA